MGCTVTCVKGVGEIITTVLSTNELGNCGKCVCVCVCVCVLRVCVFACMLTR